MDDIPEPADGKWLVAEDSDGGQRLVYRSNDISVWRPGPADKRWFYGDDDGTSEAMTWAEVLATAIALYELTPYPPPDLDRPTVNREIERLVREHWQPDLSYGRQMSATLALIKDLCAHSDTTVETARAETRRINEELINLRADRTEGVR